MENSIKFCKDCKFATLRYGKLACKRNLKKEYDLVNGVETLINYLDCNVERSGGFWRCGTSAKYFELKENS